MLLFTHRWFTLIYSDGKNAMVFGWTLATKAYLYYNIFTVYLNYILSNLFFFFFFFFFFFSSLIYHFVQRLKGKIKQIHVKEVCLGCYKIDTLKLLVRRQNNSKCYNVRFVKLYHQKSYFMYWSFLHLWHRCSALPC